MRVGRLVAIFLLAAALRFAHVAAIGEAPFARLLIGDARSYDRWAKTIAGGDWLGTATFYQAPLYPYLLGAYYRIAGTDPMGVRWAQALAGAAACVLLAWAGRAWLGERDGLAAGAILAVYPPAIYFDGIVQKAALDNVLMCALLAVLGAFVLRRDRRLMLAAGAVLGLFALSRENALVFFAIIAAWLAWRRLGLAPVALLAAGTALVLAPVAIRNRVVGGELLITTSQAGSNFYIGNGPSANGAYVPIRPGREMPEFERTDATQVAQAAIGHPLTPGEVSSYWWSRSLSWIRENPGAWLRLMGRKWMLVWNRVELPDTESFEVYRDASVVLRALAAVLGFGILVALGAAGMVLAWRVEPRPDLLYLMLFGYAAAVAAFYVFARYRYPLVPILALFAGHALVRGWGLLAARDLRRLRPAAIAAALALVVSCWPILSMAGTRALSYANLGIGFAEEGRLDEAIVLFRKSIDLYPSEPDAHYNLAVALDQLGQEEQAANELVTVLRLDPGFAAAHDNLGVLLARSGNFADAERHFREALRLDPSSPLTRNNLGNIAQERGRVDEAVRLYQDALRIEPGYVEARMNLVEALARSGRPDEALREAREVLRRDPSNAEAASVVRALSRKS